MKYNRALILAIEAVIGQDTKYALTGLSAAEFLGVGNKTDIAHIVVEPRTMMRLGLMVPYASLIVELSHTKVEQEFRLHSSTTFDVMNCKQRDTDNSVYTIPVRSIGGPITGGDQCEWPKYYLTGIYDLFARHSGTSVLNDYSDFLWYRSLLNFMQVKEAMGDSFNQDDPIFMNARQELYMQAADHPHRVKSYFDVFPNL